MNKLLTIIVFVFSVPSAHATLILGEFSGTVFGAQGTHSGIDLSGLNGKQIEGGFSFDSDTFAAGNWAVSPAVPSRIWERIGDVEFEVIGSKNSYLTAHWTRAAELRFGVSDGPSPWDYSGDSGNAGFRFLNQTSGFTLGPDLRSMSFAFDRETFRGWSGGYNYFWEPDASGGFYRPSGGLYFSVEEMSAHPAVSAPEPPMWWLALAGCVAILFTGGRARSLRNVLRRTMTPAIPTSM